MIFSKDLIPSVYDKKPFHIIKDIEEVNALFLIIVHLHKQGKINDEKLSSMFNSLKKGTLQRKVNTYHCKINNTWYSDETMFNILCDVYQDVCVGEDLDIETILKYLNKYLNANRNYCINYIYTTFISPLIYENKFKILKTFEVYDFGDEAISYEEADRLYDLSFGYCCSDCDGCLGRYKSSRYHNDYETKYDDIEIRKSFITALNNLKTKNYLKSPHQLHVYQWQRE